MSIRRFVGLCFLVTACGGDPGVAGPDTTAAESPSARWLPALAYEAPHSQMLLFGGSNGVSSPVPTFFSDLWAWNGATWTRLSTSGPSARDGAVLAYDSNRQRTVVFGGRAASSTGSTTVQLNDTWEWNGTSWTQIAVNGPPARAHMAGGYDPQRRRVVVHGGTNPDGSPLLDTWEYDGVAWTRQSTTTPSSLTLPSPLVYDSGTSALLTIVGDLASGRTQLWQWSGTAWLNLGDAPRVDLPAALVATSASNLLLADVGSTSQQNHRWNGTAWSALGGAMPTRRFGAAIGYDAGRQQAVLFGGMDQNGRVLNDTWVWSGSAWSRR